MSSEVLTPIQTALVVDDDEDVVAAVSHALGGAGVRVVSTNDPTEALALLEADGQVEVLVADVDMPQMNGVELALAVKRAHPLVVRLMLTGSTSMPTVLRAINEGEVYRYLTKPWKNDELIATVRDAFAQAARLRRLAAAEARDARRAAVLAELTRCWPGIDVVAELDERCIVDDTALAAVRARTGLTGAALVAALLRELDAAG